MVGVLAVAVTGCTGPSDSEFEEVATSAQASKDRAVAVTRAEEQLGLLRTAMPWLVWRDSSLVQRCERSGGLVGGARWGTRCSTIVRQYAGIDMDLVDEIRRFHDSLGKDEWESYDSDVRAAIETYQKNGGKTAPRAYYDAAKLTAIRYSHRSGSYCDRAEPPWTLTHRWLEAGHPVATSPQEDFELTEHGKEVFFQAHRTLDHQAVKTNLLTRHRYIAVLTLTSVCNYEVAD